jgi:hypothetical protein
MAKSPILSAAPLSPTAPPELVSDTWESVIAKIPRGSDGRADLEARIRELIRRGRSDDEIREELSPQLAQVTACSQSSCDALLTLFTQIARKG